MGKYTIFYLFENPRRGMQARNFTTNVPKILDLKSSSEQIFFRKLSLGAPVCCCHESASSTLTVLATGGPSSPQERGRDSCLRCCVTTVIYKGLYGM